MTRRIILYLSITLALIALIVISERNINLGHIQANLPTKEQVSEISAELAIIDLPELPTVEPTYTPLPKGKFLSPHAQVIRSDRDGWVLSEDFVYVDSFGKEWIAPAGTKTDGASIPQAFLSATGDRLDGDYLDAAVVHDAYCQGFNSDLETYQSETWQYVHYMFYEALLTTGVPEQQAKMMYAAVYMGGPRWGEDVEIDGAVVIGTKENGSSLTGVDNSSLRVVDAEPTAEELAEFEAMLEWIESENPTGKELQDRLEESSS
ncbi:MAG: DUF1353 domain-containing protein [Chloroflexota bacterium]